MQKLKTQSKNLNSLEQSKPSESQTEATGEVWSSWDKEPHASSTVTWPWTNQPAPAATGLLQQPEHSQPIHSGEARGHTSSGMWPLAQVAENTGRTSLCCWCCSLGRMTELGWAKCPNKVDLLITTAGRKIPHVAKKLPKCTLRIQKVQFKSQSYTCF